MAPLPPPLAAEKEFERALLSSAEADAPPEGAARRALARFATEAALLARVAPPPPSTTLPRGKSLGKWLGWGVVASTALVAAYWVGRTTASPASVSAAPPPLDVSAAVVSAPRAVSPASVTAVTVPTASSPAPRKQLDSASARRAIAPTKQSPSMPPTTPSLAEELARLDAARTALAIGDFDGTARELARYEAEFPRGSLAREADLVAITALSEKGDRAEAMRRARRFLTLYPRDVHAARVKELVSWQSLEPDPR